MMQTQLQQEIRGFDRILQFARQHRNDPTRAKDWRYIDCKGMLSMALSVSHLSCSSDEVWTQAIRLICDELDY